MLLTAMAAPHPKVWNLASVITPILNKTKKEIVKTGTKLGVPFQYTWSCYKGGKKPCGTCESCAFRAKGFQSADIVDPIGV
ncbi:exsB protein [Candidatus Omnitrophus magneticus]|uniref:7-cyano-7-deazaguanine synthase n=1 Tax=Candidatus Omnitrophus magneticus TaxID=1609969 RepID=A0A0F0CQL5_9BACT|nr:exsB protein [Candidatus Omnitrophus magneticus]